MNAINHAATALLLKKRWPNLPVIPALISVQLIEFLWVFLNLAGVEVTTIASPVHAMDDIHLSYMPYSHSLGSVLLIAGLVWLLLRTVANRSGWAVPIALGICSHIVLDVLVHAPDIEVIPSVTAFKIGSGLYEVPVFALVAETLFATFCWWVYGGSRALLWTLVGLNLAAASFYVPQIPGPEALLAGHPKVFALVILVHIVLGLCVVGFFLRRAESLPDA
jgi:membrane-bound metal-dependent hydrolase YbcI (DUF457 family)